MSTSDKVPPSHPDIGLTGRKIIYDENGKPYVFFNDSSITNTMTLFPFIHVPFFLKFLTGEYLTQ